MPARFKSLTPARAYAWVTPVASVNPYCQSTLASASNFRQRVVAGLRARQVKFTNVSNTFRSQITAVLHRNCAGRGMCDN